MVKTVFMRVTRRCKRCGGMFEAEDGEHRDMCDDCLSEVGKKKHKKMRHDRMSPEY